MFHHHTSTGEPPTPPAPSLTASVERRLRPEVDDDSNSKTNIQESAEEIDVPWLILDDEASLSQTDSRSRQDAIPSHDSGYERSPANLNQADSPQFFMEVFDDVHTSNSVPIEDDELCSDCDGECDCNPSTPVVQTLSTPPSIALGQFCDTCSNEQSSSPVRPSTLPIEIPVRQSVDVSPPTSFSWLTRLPSRSLPVPPNYSQLSSFQVLPQSQPGMWPNVILSMTRLNSIELLTGLRDCSRGSSRLRLLNSSISSSIESFFDVTSIEPIDDDLDNVFEPEMFEVAEEEFAALPDARRRLNSDVSPHPLPDLVLQSGARRNRSASVNLPPDHAVLRDIGRSLRRISDDFSEARRARQQQERNEAQSQCISSIFTIFRRE